MNDARTIAITDAPLEKRGRRYSCQRHGEHDATMHVSIPRVLHRVYCMHCLVEAYDRLGIREMDVLPKSALK